jgi:hemerythrin-like domain-containing protein
MNAKATQDEHRIIDQVVGSMAVLVEKLERVGKSSNRIHRFIRISSDLWDMCHHGKEEAYLFKFLERKGVPVSCSSRSGA